MYKYVKVNVGDLVVGKEYCQQKGPKAIPGELYYLGEDAGGYKFEDHKGIEHILSAEDLEETPVWATTVTMDAIRRARREESLANTKYGHDPLELIREAHRTKYGYLPRYTSIGQVQEDDTVNGILGYRANILGQDYLLLLKRTGKKVDYTCYDYGMAFPSERDKGLTGSQLHNVIPEKKGARVAVDNDACIVAGENGGMFFFIPTAQKNRGKHHNCTIEHVNVYHNVRVELVEKGTLQENFDYKGGAESREEKAKETALVAAMERELSRSGVNDKANKGAYLPMVDNYMSESSEDVNVASVFASFRVGRTKYALSANQLKEGTRYETPVGTLKYKGRYRKYGRKLQYYVPDSKGWREDTTRTVNDVIGQMYVMGAKEMAKTMEMQKVVHMFLGYNGQNEEVIPVYFDSGDIQAGIIAGEVLDGEDYSTPDGVGTYTYAPRESNVFTKHLIKSIAEHGGTAWTPDMQGKMLALLEGKPLNITNKELRKVAEEAEGLQQIYRNLVVNSTKGNYFTFNINGADKSYSYENILTGRIVRVSSPGHISAMERRQKRNTNRVKTKEQLISIERNKSNVEKAPESIININKVSYRRLQPGEIYTTAYGELKYMPIDIKDTNNKKIYPFYDENGVNVVNYTAKDIIAGAVTKRMYPGNYYWVAGNKCIYRGYDIQENGRIRFIFQQANGKNIAAGYRAIMMGSVRPVDKED